MQTEPNRWLRRLAAPLALAAAGSAYADGFVFAPTPTPRALPAVSFLNADGKPQSLAQFRGKVVLLNVWATWCPPCVEEMPTLGRLQAALGGKDFQVLALSVDKGGVFAVKSFYQENFIEQLPVDVDPTARALDDLHVLGTPTTILIDREGREIARTLGPEDWDKPAVLAQLRRIIAAPAR
jgi:thiol-disulfide isomerase/thioredoxin